MNRIKRACRHTGTLAEAAVVTGLGSGVLHHAHHNAVAETAVLVILSRLLTSARALYKCHLALLRSCFHAHNRTDLFRNRGSANRTSADLSLPLYDCRRKAGTACIAAAAAVISRKDAHDGLLTLVNFHCKLLSCHSEKHTNE